MDTDEGTCMPATRGYRYTVSCRHCGRVVFRNAHHISPLQLEMMESHVLICRPLAALAQITDLFTHCRIAQTQQ